MTRERDDLHPALANLIQQLPDGTYEITDSGVFVHWSSVFGDDREEPDHLTDEIVELLEFLDALAAYTDPASRSLLNAAWLVQHGWTVPVAARAFGLDEPMLRRVVDAIRTER